ncbi:hypothetical protein SO802_017444 [Lithocarpus litseifolius]|uniref:Uncharacterized protein n=1 Tax=Lithocarpus litseifolius TaxID=425828 RepID=A0AAW2CJB3_9ROSI
MYSSTQAGPSTSAPNELPTFNEYNPINVNEYCMSLYEHVGSSTSLGQRFEDSQYNYEQHDSFITPQPSQSSPHVGDFYTPPNTWACAPNSKEEASVTDSEEDASNEDNGEDVENAKDMEVLSDNETDEGGNYQTNFDIRTKPRHMGTSPVQARRDWTMALVDALSLNPFLFEAELILVDLFHDAA